MKAIAFAVILLFFIAVQSDAQVPGIVWERVYFNGYICFFNDVHETFDGGFIVAGARTQGSGGGDCIFRMDSDGNLLWIFGYNDWWGQGAYWIEELPDHGFIATGGATAYSGDDVFLFLLRLDADGNEIWTKVYDIETSYDVGSCVTPLPDGGFAVCGTIEADTGMADGWILRTDSFGDTLWTKRWGWDFWDRARRVLYVDTGLSVLTNGRLDGDPGGTYIVRYDMDGNLLWENQLEELYGEYGWDMCYSSSDGGYTLVTHPQPIIAHTDSIGNVIWQMNPTGIGNADGYSINPTMDGGYIYAGQNKPYEPDQYEYSGMLVKLDSEGNQQWWDFVYESDCEGLFSARQLSQGGYIAAGIAESSLNGPGFLIRYEPEVGIEGGAGLPGVVQLDVSPNPFSSSLGISYSLPDPGQIELSVYDLSGRLVVDLMSGSISSGEHVSVWNSNPAVPDGCYLIVLDACGERSVRRVVLLR